MGLLLHLTEGDVGYRIISSLDLHTPRSLSRVSVSTAEVRHKPIIGCAELKPILYFKPITILLVRRLHREGPLRPSVGDG
jgi:hypothetical protein